MNYLYYLVCVFWSGHRYVQRLENKDVFVCDRCGAETSGDWFKRLDGLNQAYGW